MTQSPKHPKKWGTRIVEAGRNPEAFHGAVNPPVYHASTILFPTVDAMMQYETNRVRYGRHGTPGTHAFEDAMCEIEGGAAACLAPSGLAAVTGALLAFLKAGDHLLMVDTVYDPTRGFCDTMLAGLGIETTYYNPLDTEGLRALIRPQTKVIFAEAPGSRTFEMQDLPALVAIAQESASDIVTMIDNTWATPVYFRPLDFGIDVSIQAATKYIVGHADAMLGVATGNARVADQLVQGFRVAGHCAGPDDVYLGFRGLKTLPLRLKQHSDQAMALIAWIADQPDCARILYPAWPEDPGYGLWRRDFSGATGLFGFVMQGGTWDQAKALLDTLNLFGMGFSWGGYESLIVPNRSFKRLATPWDPEGPSFRIHAGLEDVDDLIADLEKGFAAFRAAAS
ncbi:MAG: cystathionine beta-lyase [Pseudomonadota bacterium]